MLFSPAMCDCAEGNTHSPLSTLKEAHHTRQSFPIACDLPKWRARMRPAAVPVSVVNAA
jgi:hypothetical protein